MSTTPRPSRFAFCLLAACCLVGIGNAYAQPGEHVVTIGIDQIDSNHWEAVVSLTNSDPLAAMTLPLTWGKPKTATPFRLDSADYTGMRSDYFALKTFRVDTAKNAVLIGLISDLGSDLPPLEPGSGPIVRLHFSTRGPSPAPLFLDTTFLPPHNVLQLVTPDVRSIKPLFLRPSRKSDTTSRD